MDANERTMVKYPIVFVNYSDSYQWIVCSNHSMWMPVPGLATKLNGLRVCHNNDLFDTGCRWMVTSS